LIQDLQNLFDAFIQTIGSAIDEKSTYTGGHIRRVADLTMMIAEEINLTNEGLWGRLNFNEDELNELRIAAWMHDVGKITTPEYVVDKATKLETIYDRIEIVTTRYEVLKRDAEIAGLKRKLALLEKEEPEEWADVEASVKRELAEIEAELAFITQCNTGGEFMADEDLEKIGDIASRTFVLEGKPQRRLTTDAVHNLSIRKGTLTDDEREIINNHAAVSVKMLSQLPFSKKLSKVPEYAGGHHEKLNGLGYPVGLTAEELPLQARIMAVADILEALTAPDRPYREPMALSQALKIIGFMVKDGELDGKIVDLAINSGLVFTYADRELNEDQNDVKPGP
jgi:response regulator RpfG family c-di-GMP phosphodiesterase